MPLRTGTTIRRRAARAGMAAVVLVLLCGCSWFGERKPPQPDCPRVAVLSDAATLTRFRPGPGRDITDMVLSAQVADFNGTCHYDYDTQVLTVKLTVGLDLIRGPAAQGRAADIGYFVAIPAYYPKPQAKRVWPLKLQFPNGADRMHYEDEGVDIVIPIKNVKVDYPKIEIFIGLQLNQEELDYNRTHKPAGL